MNPLPNLNPQLGKWLSELVDGRIDDRRFNELQQLLARDGNALEAYLAYVDLHVCLPRNLSCLDASLADSVGATGPADPVGIGEQTPLGWRSTIANLWPSACDWLRRPILRYSLVVALMLYGAFFAVIWNIRNKPIPGRPVDQLAVFTKLGTTKVRWSAGIDSKLAADKINRRESLRLESGIVSLQLKLGTAMLVEGPAEWSVAGANQVHLVSGKVVASVPPAAVGFVIDTPTARIRDLGTEFFVQVDRGGNSDVHVSKGRVDVEPARGKKKNTAVRLQAGQSAVISSDGSKVQIKELPDKFRKLADASKTLEFQANGATDDAAPKYAVRLQQGADNILGDESYQGCLDTQLISWAADFNFGKRADFNVGSVDGKSRACSLVRFDLTSFAGRFSKIRKARLVLYQDSKIAVSAPGTVFVHVLAKANRDWMEGDGVSAGVASQPGANWKVRKPGMPWASEPGASRADVDYASAVLASLKYEARYTNRPFIFDIKGDLGFLETWANDDATNAGFVLRGDDSPENNRMSFVSSDSPDQSLRPALEIEFEPLATKKTQ